MAAFPAAAEPAVAPAPAPEEDAEEDVETPAPPVEAADPADADKAVVAAGLGLLVAVLVEAGLLPSLPVANMVDWREAEPARALAAAEGEGGAIPPEEGVASDSEEEAAVGDDTENEVGALDSFPSEEEEEAAGEMETET